MNARSSLERSFCSREVKDDKHDHLATGGQTVREEMARKKEASGSKGSAQAQATATQGAKKGPRQTDGPCEGHRLTKPCAV